MIACRAMQRTWACTVSAWGALTVVTKSAEVTSRVESQLKQVSTLHVLSIMHLLASATCMQAHCPRPCPLPPSLLWQMQSTGTLPSGNCSGLMKQTQVLSASHRSSDFYNCCDKALLPCRLSGPCSATRPAMERPLWWRCSATHACMRSGG